MTDLSPVEIVQMREDIARMLCARNIRAHEHPSEDPLQITESDLANVPKHYLHDMVLLITPVKAILQ